MSALLRTFAAAVPGVVYAKDLEGRMLVANHGTTALIGKPPEFYLGKTDLEFLPDKTQARQIMETDQRIMRSGEGGRISISTFNQVLEQGPELDAELLPGAYLTICVADDGAGMSPETLSKAFEPFFTTKPVGAGTGLGLSMVYGFVKQSGGQMKIDSEEGVGTRVYLQLPVEAAQAEAVKQTAPKTDVDLNLSG
nr:two component histidine kinase, putative [Tanacetum cinerariifolium]